MLHETIMLDFNAVETLIYEEVHLTGSFNGKLAVLACSSTITNPRAHAHARTCACTRPHMHMHTHMHTHSNTSTHNHTLASTQSHARMQICTRRYGAKSDHDVTITSHTLTRIQTFTNVKGAWAHIRYLHVFLWAAPQKQMQLLQLCGGALPSYPRCETLDDVRAHFIQKLSVCIIANW